MDISLYGCRSCNFTCKYCFGPDKSKDEPFVLDKIAVLETLSRIGKKAGESFVIWGGEPLLHWEPFKETVEFLQEQFPEKKINFSTNGFLLQKEEVRKYIDDHKLRVQLSCDGVGQWVRSKYDPLSDDVVSEFLKNLALDDRLYINCVVHNQNPSVTDNINNFLNWMKNWDLMDSNLDIRFTPFYESDLTPEWNFTGENLHKFIHEYETLFIRQLTGDRNDKVLKHFRKDIMHRVNGWKLKKVKTEESNLCMKFFCGINDESPHIDTKGKFVSCNLIDSGIDPRGKQKKVQPEYCKGCEFEGAQGCQPCPSTDFADHCEFKKEWMRFNKRMSELKRKISTDKKYRAKLNRKRNFSIRRK